MPRKGYISILEKEENQIFSRITPIVPDQLWDAVRKLDAMTTKVSVNGRKPITPCLCSQLFFCAECGFVLHQHARARNRTWICKNLRCTSNIRLREIVGDHIIAAGLQELLDNKLDEIQNLVQKYRESRVRMQDNTARLKRQLSEKNKLCNDFERAMIEGVPENHPIRKRYTALLEEIETLNSTIGAAERAKAECAKECAIDKTKLKSILADFDTLKKSNISWLHQSIKMLVGKIFIKSRSGPNGCNIIEGYSEIEPCRMLSFFGDFVVSESVPAGDPTETLSDIDKKVARIGFIAHQSGDCIHIKIKG